MNFLLSIINYLVTNLIFSKYLNMCPSEFNSIYADTYSDRQHKTLTVFLPNYNVNLYEILPLVY